MRYLTLRGIFWFLLWTIYRFTGGIRVEGRDKIPANGGVLITPNHISNADPPTVVYATRRYCYVMAASELFELKAIGRLITMLRGFPVKRGVADRAAIRRAEELLQQGEVVVIFPEGELSESGTLLPILPGALLVAQRSGVPIVPAAIVDSDRLMPYGKVVPRLVAAGIVVRFGDPVTYTELSGGKRGSAGLAAAADQLAQLLIGLGAKPPVAELEGGAPEPKDNPGA
jgi:1-acyl-sn-glycerol-3-phosphate acyltransferase